MRTGSKARRIFVPAFRAGYTMEANGAAKTRNPVMGGTRAPASQRRKGVLPMETVYRMATALVRALRSRLFAAASLAVMTAVMVAVVTVNTHAVTVVDGDTSRVVLTMNEDPYYVLKTAGVTLGKDDVVHTAENGQRPASIEITRRLQRADQRRRREHPGRHDRRHRGRRAGKGADYRGRARYPERRSGRSGGGGHEPHGRTGAVPRAYQNRSYRLHHLHRYTNVLPKGKTQIKQAGQNGVKTLTYRDRIVDGQVVETELVGEAVTKKPVEKIVLKGTIVGTPMSKAPFDIELDSAGQPVKYKSMISGKATAYTSDRGDSGTICSTGMKAQVGVVAVNPKRIPYGSKLYITSPDGSYIYGYAIAGDTGGGVRKNALVADLFMDTYEECIQFGRRTMNVYILE